MSVPYVIEPHKDGERVYDLYSRMLKDRIVFFRGKLSPEVGDAIVAQLLFLETSDRESDIYLYINSPGGHLSAMYGIYDTIQYIAPDVVTLVYGQASSAAAFILAAGAPGKRYALKNSEIMIHEFATGVQGKAHEIRNYWKRGERLYEKMAKDMVELTGQKLSKVKRDMEIDYFMGAEEAKNYGIIDKIQYKRG
jgi:ATP-dependent Clp protease protease subunit